MLHQFGDQTGDNELCVQPVLLQTGRIRQRLNTNPGNIKVFDSWNIWNVHSEKKGDQNYNEIQRNLLLLLYGYIHLFTNMICTCNCDVHHQVLPNLTPLSSELLGCKHSHNHQLRNRFTNNVAFSWLSELILEFKWMNVFFFTFFSALCAPHCHWHVLPQSPLQGRGTKQSGAAGLSRGSAFACSVRLKHSTDKYRNTRLEEARRNKGEPSNRDMQDRGKKCISLSKCDVFTFTLLSWHKCNKSNSSQTWEGLTFRHLLWCCFYY